MPAHIGECPQLPVLAANDDRGLVRDVEHLEIAGVRQLRLVTGYDPVSCDHPLQFQFVYRRVGVEALREREARSMFADQACNVVAKLGHCGITVGSTYSQSNFDGVGWEDTR